jgi:hypothetical protein
VQKFIKDHIQHVKVKKGLKSPMSYTACDIEERVKSLFLLKKRSQCNCIVPRSGEVYVAGRPKGLSSLA